MAVIRYHKTFTFKAGGPPAPTAEKRPARSPSPAARVLVGLLCSLFLAASLYQMRKEYRLKTEGVPAQGQVIYTERRTGKGGPHYRVRFGYLDAAGGRHAADGRISADSYRRLQPGNLLDIYYVPAEPSIAETAEMRSNVKQMLISGFFGVGLNLFLLIAVVLRRRSGAAPSAPPPGDPPAPAGYNIPKIIS